MRMIAYLPSNPHPHPDETQNHEYAHVKDANRARSYFFDGSARIMLYTERAHFYRRQTIRGIRDVYFYSLPDREE